MRRSPLIIGGAIVGVVGALGLFAASGSTHLGAPRIGSPSTTLAPSSTTTSTQPKAAIAAPTTSSPSQPASSAITLSNATAVATSSVPLSSTSKGTISIPIGGAEGEGPDVGNSGTGNTGIGNSGDGGSGDHATVGSLGSLDN